MLIFSLLFSIISQAHSSGWVQIAPNDDTRLEALVADLKSVSPNYPMVDLAYVKRWLKKENAEIWTYNGDGFRLAIDFKYSSGRKMPTAQHVLVHGNVKNEVALGLFKDKIFEYLTRHGYKSFYTATPKNLLPSRTLDFGLWAYGILSGSKVEDNDDRLRYEFPVEAVK